ncbi:MAG: cell division protein FtsW, partial [Alphaproteobacteria bacterium]
MKLKRSDRSLLSDWWYTIDRLMLPAVLLLMAGGLVLSLAASPSVAERLGYDTFHFFKRHAAAFVPALMVLLGASLLAPRQVRRVSLAVFVTGIVLMVATLLVGPETKGATRWLRFGPLSVQPSEFVKPAFVVLSAWFFAESQRRDDVPSLHIALLLYAVFVLLLILQP